MKPTLGRDIDFKKPVNSDVKMRIIIGLWLAGNIIPWAFAPIAFSR